jgi:hypothetical protein
MREPSPGAVFEPLRTYREYPPAEMEARSRDFAADLGRRRTVRQFSDRPVSRAVIEACVTAAGTAPSGAHLQPWHFVVVSDLDLKRRIRVAAETAEREFYARAPQEWLDALAPLGTDAHKPYLETAPWLIAVFAERYGLTAEARRRTHYYVMESVGIATGLLLAALRVGTRGTKADPGPAGNEDRGAGRGSIGRVAQTNLHLAAVHEEDLVLLQVHVHSPGVARWDLLVPRNQGARADGGGVRHDEEWPRSRGGRATPLPNPARRLHLARACPHECFAIVPIHRHPLHRRAVHLDKGVCHASRDELLDLAGAGRLRQTGRQAGGRDRG